MPVFEAQSPQTLACVPDAKAPNDRPFNSIDDAMMPPALLSVALLRQQIGSKRSDLRMGRSRSAADDQVPGAAAACPRGPRQYGRMTVSPGIIWK